MKLAIPAPAVKRRTLVLTAGIVWILAGTMLLTRAILWLFEVDANIYLIVITAVIIGLLKNRFMFSKIIKKNLSRIHELAPHKEKICIFAFQAFQSYLLVLLMISAGHILRLTPIRRDILALIYLAIGTALFSAGINYFLSLKKFSTRLPGENPD